MKIVFCFSNFVKKNLGLQPWVTVHRIGLGLTASGHEVHVVTDQEQDLRVDGIAVHCVGSLRGAVSKKIDRCFRAIRPDCIVVSVTPMSLASAAWYRSLGNYRTYAFFSYPLYQIQEIINAIPHMSKSERWLFGRNLLIPRCVWTMRLTNLFNGVICQSKKTANLVKCETRSRASVNVIPPGIDLGVWDQKSEWRYKDDDKTFLFVGRPSGIRGFFVLLDAFSQVSGPGFRLKILARGADGNDVKKIWGEVERRGIQGRVEIKGGWLETEQLKREFQRATAVLLPFVLVPSELPISVMEAIACGTPAIVSNIDGLPDATGHAGIVVPQSDAESLAAAMRRFQDGKHLQETLNLECMKQRDKMLSWDSVCSRWEDVLSV